MRRYRPRPVGLQANLIMVYYHPGLASWVAALGDPAAPVIQCQQPSSAAALRQLLTEIQSSGHQFDATWAPE